MDVMEAIAARRSVRKFTDAPLPRERIEPLFDAAVMAPNHRMTEPWRFHVLGPTARRAYGDVLGGRKARKVEDVEAAKLVREKVANEHAALPAMIAVSMKLADDPETREEDYAATMMGVQNLLLAATAAGIATHLKTGAVMQDPGARAAVGAADDERIVAVIHAGIAEDVPAAKARKDARDLTTWTK
jgi:nitroreductase